MSARTKVILGLVGAAAVGFAVGMLMAPETGADTRKKIASTAGDWGTSLSDLFSSAKDGVDKLRRRGADLASEAADRYSTAKESFS
ncbi:YtxH domain-containing protein [Flavisolibacter nicotianae]|uniref:YtxH domain-containing protein n=1 Tax=Flavisolibacter nicotianae TaxID=2364882 RepID=UPI000EB3B6B0|nr:YtxH domain-containing protein [Flavisolibacter nicotianae]